MKKQAWHGFALTPQQITESIQNHVYQSMHINEDYLCKIASDSAGVLTSGLNKNRN